jgi:hypothetical protein
MYFVNNGNVIVELEHPDLKHFLGSKSVDAFRKDSGLLQVGSCMLTS